MFFLIPHIHYLASNTKLEKNKTLLVSYPFFVYSAEQTFSYLLFYLAAINRNYPWAGQLYMNNIWTLFPLSLVSQSADYKPDPFRHRYFAVQLGILFWHTCLFIPKYTSHRETQPENKECVIDTKTLSEGIIPLLHAACFCEGHEHHLSSPIKRAWLDTPRASQKRGTHIQTKY